MIRFLYVLATLHMKSHFLQIICNILIRWPVEQKCHLLKYWEDACIQVTGACLAEAGTAPLLKAESSRHAGFSTEHLSALPAFVGPPWRLERVHSPSLFSLWLLDKACQPWLIDANCAVGFTAWLSLPVDWYEVDGTLIRCCNLSVRLTVLSTSRFGLRGRLSQSYSLIHIYFSQAMT